MSTFFPILQKAKEDIERLRTKLAELLEDYCELVEKLADSTDEVDRLRAENNHLNTRNVRDRRILSIRVS